MKRINNIISITLFTLLIGACNNVNNNQTKENMKSGKFTSIAVFGDGLSDMGQWGKLTNFKYPPASVGFYESRWTNGKTWVEYFADSLGLKLSLENNFAMGGATTGLYNINEPLKPILGLDSTVTLKGMLAQVQSYLDSKPSIDDKTLCVLWAGGHDIGNYLEYGQPDLKQYPPAQNYKSAIELMINAGIKNIMIGTMPDMGFTPMYYGTEKQQNASQLCTDLNKGLNQLETDFSKNGVNIYLFDGASVFAKIGANPKSYGITYTEAYLPYDIIDFSNPLKEPTKEISNKTKGLNPDEFMNWWAVSASAKVHKIVAEEALKFINSK
jgi:phospholipase/lecithinase/hemolysin